MNALEIATAAGMCITGVAMLLSCIRLVLGPTAPDRILALDTLYVATIALLVQAGMHFGFELLFEAALVIAMIGFFGTVVLAKYVVRRDIVE